MHELCIRLIITLLWEPIGIEFFDSHYLGYYLLPLRHQSEIYHLLGFNPGFMSL